MQARRRREASTLSDWPYLSLLAVYRETPVLEAAQEGVRLDDAALEEAKVLYLTSPGGGQALDTQRRARTMGTVMGVAAFARTLAPEGAEPVRAVHSTRRRMLWIEPEQGYFLHATIALPRSSRHSRRASAATTSSAASTATPSFSLDDDVLLTELRQAYHEYRLRYGSIAGALEHEGKQQLKERLEGYWGEWAERWNVTGEGGPAPIERVLDAVPRCSLLTPSTSPQLLPLLTQFAASNPSVLPILLHDATVLSLPILSSSPGNSTRAEHAPPPPLTEGDLLALVRYLHRLLPRRSLAVHADASSADSAADAPAPAAADAGSGSAWTAPFASLTSGMTSLLAPRPLALSLPRSASASPEPAPAPGTPKPTDTRATSLRAGFAALRRSEKDAVVARREADDVPGRSAAGTGWSLRSVSAGWGKLGFGGAGAGAAKEAKAEAEAATSAVDVSGEVLAPEGESAFVAAVAVGEADGAGEADAPLEPNAPPVEQEEAVSEPTTPAVELAPSVDVDELAEAMGATPGEEHAEVEVVPAPQENGGDKAVGEKDEVEEPAKRERNFELLCGEGDERDTRFHLRRYERGSLTLGLAMLPKTDPAALAWLDSRAERLLEAVESLLEVVQPPAPAYPQRHLLKHGLLVSSFSPAVPASTEPAAAADDVSTSSALLDSFRMLHSAPPVLESLTRLSTPSAPWVLHRRADAPSSSCATEDVYAVLTSATGSGNGRRELSLVDAADEGRRVLRAYGA